MVIKNSKRSGGPKTAEGKLAVSKNALKTGTYSSLPILPHENQEEFNQARFDFWELLKFFDHQSLEVARKTLAYIKPLVHLQINTDQLSEVKKLNFLIYDNIVNVYRHTFSSSGVEVLDEDLVAKKVLHGDQPLRLITSIVFEKFVEFYEAGFWCTDRKAKIEEAVIQIKQERILKIMQSDSTRRANDDLTRSFIRTISEFRKHHEWRIKNRLVDANEE